MGGTTGRRGALAHRNARRRRLGESRIDRVDCSSHIVAHRGWRQRHGENTLEALVDAIDGGCAGAEFDVRETADGCWVLSHDDNLERLHGQPLRLDEHSLDELRQHAPLPLLDDALALFGNGTVPFIDVKSPEVRALEALVERLDAFAQQRPLVIISRGPTLPNELARQLPTASVLLYNRDWDAALQYPGENLAGFDLWREGIPQNKAPAYLAELLQDDRQVAVWSVNQRAEAEMWKEVGCRWIISDRPWEFVE